MKIFECPYCNKIAASHFSFGNSFYLYNTNKKCRECLRDIKLNLPILFFFLFGIPIIGVFIPIFISDLYFDSTKIWLYRVFIILGSAILILFFYFLLGVCNKRVFLPKVKSVETWKVNDEQPRG